MRTTNCIICKNNSVNIGLLVGKSDLYKNRNLNKCSSCGFVFADPMPLEKELVKYNSKYFESAEQDIKLNKTQLAFFQAISKIRLMYVIDYLNNKSIKVSNVLEIGPGPGFFAKSFLEVYNKVNYSAIETDSSCHDSLLSLGVNIVDFESFDKKVDLIIMSHVLEHTSDPSDFILKVSEKLKSGGVLFIEVPCLDFKHKKLHEPHLLFFDKIPMNILLQKNNYHNIKVSYHGKKISKLIRNSIVTKLLNYFRNKLIKYGFVYPFSSRYPGMDFIKNRLERAVIYPYHAHIENDDESWWLRAIAIKK